MEAIYIFGIIESAEHDGPRLGRTAVTEGVHTVPYRDISAVVIDSLFVDYSYLSTVQAAHYLLTHQRVIESVMSAHAILPMKLGTYALTTEETKDILAKGYALFKKIFGKIKNKIELDITAAWNDLVPVLREVGETREIKELKETLLARPGGVSPADQIELGKLMKSGLDKKREALAAEIVSVWGAVGADSRNHPLMDDRMILNTSWLIEKSRKDEFEGLLDGLNNRIGENINFRCVGPLPPYSFYTIESKRLSFEEVDRARKALNLGTRATKEDIVKAYRASVKQCHPDTNPGMEDAKRRFNEIYRAKHTLLDCCRGDAFVFEKNEFSRNPLVIQVRE